METRGSSHCVVLLLWFTKYTRPVNELHFSEYRRKIIIFSGLAGNSPQFGLNLLRSSLLGLLGSGADLLEGDAWGNASTVGASERALEAFTSEREFLPEVPPPCCLGLSWFCWVEAWWCAGPMLGLCPVVVCMLRFMEYPWPLLIPRYSLQLHEEELCKSHPCRWRNTHVAIATS